MRGFSADLKHALRGLVRAPAFALAAVFTLALGIGANSAMFSAINALLLRPLPYAHPERLVSVYETKASRNGEQSPFSGPNFFDCRDGAKTFEVMAAYHNLTLDLAGWGAPVPIPSGQVTAGFFEVFSLRPLAGTFFTQAQEAPGSDQVVVLSEGLWRRRFGGDPKVIGTTLVLSGQLRTILGVAPSTTPFPLQSPPDLFVPQPRDPKGENRSSHMFQVVGRLRAGLGLAQTRVELESLAANLASRYPASNQGRSMQGVDLHQDMAGTTGRPLMLLMGAVALFLLIAMANVASLFLARAAARRHEVAVRIALGATGFKFLRPFLAEGLLVVLAGTVLGLLGAHFLLAGLPELLPAAGGLKSIQPIRLDGTVLAFTCLVSLGVTLLFCFAPMAAARGASLQEALLAGGRYATQQSGRLRALLVTVEISMATLLLLSSGLLLHSFLKVAGTDPGFQPKDVTVFSFQLPEERYKDDASQARFHREIMARLASMPGVEATGAAWIRPSSGSEATFTFHDGPTSDLDATWPTAPMNIVDAGYFETLRIPLKAGRMFTEVESPQSPKVLLVNEAFARTLAPGAPVLGRRLLIGATSDSAPKGTLWAIVGIVGDTRSHGLDQPAPPRIYLSANQMPLDGGAILVRCRLPASALAGPLREQLAAVDPQLAANRIRSLEDMGRDLLADRRQTMVLLGLFALLALFLGAVGIYGLLAYGVAQKGRELGVRMALGARQGQILALVMGQGVRLVALGLVLGLGGYLTAGRVMAHLVVDLSTTDPLTLLGVILLLGATGLLACLMPALRASRVDPAIALRNE